MKFLLTLCVIFSLNCGPQKEVDDTPPVVPTPEVQIKCTQDDVLALDYRAYIPCEGQERYQQVEEANKSIAQCLLHHFNMYITENRPLGYEYKIYVSTGCWSNPTDFRMQEIGGMDFLEIDCGSNYGGKIKLEIKAVSDGCKQCLEGELPKLIFAHHSDEVIYTIKDFPAYSFINKINLSKEDELCLLDTDTCYESRLSALKEKCFEYPETDTWEKERM